MENYKIKVNNWDESKEVQELYIALGATCGVEEITSKWVCLYNGQITFYDLLPNVYFKQITIQSLKDLVILKRNSIEDATHYYGGSKYYLTDSEFYQYSDGKWVNIDEYVVGMTFKKIDKGCEVKNKEYLKEQDDGSYNIILAYRKEGNTWIEVPEGAEEYRDNNRFYKNNGKLYYSPYEEWVKSGLTNYKTLWQRNPNTPNTSIQDRLKFIEKWLNGEKIQYILGIESEKSKWHNFTEGAMQYIKRPDIKFREAPKYVTINGIEFKSVEKLVRYVKNNFDLEYGE